MQESQAIKVPRNLGGDHRHIGFGSERAHGRGRQRRDAADQIELASLQSPAKFASYHVLENHITRPGHGRVDGPAKLVAATQHLSEKVDRPSDPFIVDEMHVGKPADIRCGQFFAITDMGDEGDAKVGPDCEGEIEADEWNARSRGIASLRDQKDSKRAEILCTALLSAINFCTATANDLPANPFHVYCFHINGALSMRTNLAGGFLALILAIPVAAAPDSKKPAPPDDGADIAEKLMERIDLDKYDRVFLRTALEVLSEKIGFSIILDYTALQAVQDDDVDGRKVLEERPITMPSMKRVRLETILRLILDQVNAEFILMPDHISVTSATVKDYVSGPARILRELNQSYDQPTDQLDRSFTARYTANVTMKFRDVPVGEALNAVATRTGRSFTLASDSTDKSRTVISVSLNNLPYESAISTLAEAAGLRAFRNGNAIVVLSAARAKTLEIPQESGGGCCSFSVGGRSVSLEELESIARLFPAARPIDATTAKLGSLTKEAAARDSDFLLLQAEKSALEAKLKTLAEEVEKLRKK